MNAQSQWFFPLTLQLVSSPWRVAASVISRSKSIFRSEPIFSYDKPSSFNDTTRSMSLRPNLSLLPPSMTLGIGAETCFLHLQQYLLLTTYCVATALAGTMSSTTLVYESV